MTDEVQFPCWMYSKEDGEVVSKLFKEGPIPKGWVDSPAAIEVKETLKLKPKEAENVDSEGSDKQGDADSKGDGERAQSK